MSVYETEMPAEDLIRQATWPGIGGDLAALLEEAGWQITDLPSSAGWSVLHRRTTEFLHCLGGDLSQQWVTEQPATGGLPARFLLLPEVGLDGERKLAQVCHAAGGGAVEVTASAVIVSEQPWGDLGSRQERDRGLDELGVSVVRWMGLNMAEVHR